MQKPTPTKLNKIVFLPPIFFLVLTIGYSLYDDAHFLKLANAANQWILQNFDWLFTWSTFLFLVLLVIIYFSPLGKVKIGGQKAKPLLTPWRWFAITICTTLATGVLFWGTAEPLYHLHQPPSELGASPNSAESAIFAMSTMFMHWSFTPYGIYTVTGLMFALSYYNLKQPFSISSLFYPLFKERAHGKFGAFWDVICLYGLVAGMSASLGAGIFALMGGLETVFGVEQSNFYLGFIGFAVVITFIISAISGLQKGIRFLSHWNILTFFALAIFVFFAGPTLKILTTGFDGILDYTTSFLSRSTGLGVEIDNKWLHSWTVFYWANWFAWAPIAALFLGRIALGYTVRDFIHYNLIFPSLFAIVWMSIFSGSALHYDVVGEGSFFQLLTTKGEESIMYAIFDQLPLGQLISIITLITIFVSYVTAADSNISAMSAMSTQGISQENPEAPLWIKIVWGTLIGMIAFDNNSRN